VLRAELALVPAACLQMERREADRSKGHSLEIICRVGITTLQAVCCVHPWLCKPVNSGHKFTLTGVFPCFFIGCKANARVKLAKTGHGPYSSTLVVVCVIRLFMSFCVLFVCKCVLPPGDNPIAVNKYIISNHLK